MLAQNLIPQDLANSNQLSNQKVESEDSGSSNQSPSNPHLSL